MKINKIFFKEIQPLSLFITIYINYQSIIRQRDISSGDVEASAQICQDGVPSGYEAVSLVEALNGPTLPHRARQVPTTFTSDATLQSVFCDNLVSSNGGVLFYCDDNDGEGDDDDDDDDDGGI